MICYIEVPFIDNDLLYDLPFIDSDLLEVPFLDNDLLYRGDLYRQWFVI